MYVPYYDGTVRLRHFVYLSYSQSADAVMEEPGDDEPKVGVYAQLWLYSGVQLYVLV